VLEICVERVVGGLPRGRSCLGREPAGRRDGARRARASRQSETSAPHVWRASRTRLRRALDGASRERKPPSETCASRGESLARGQAEISPSGSTRSRWPVRALRFHSYSLVGPLRQARHRAGVDATGRERRRALRGLFDRCASTRCTVSSATCGRFAWTGCPPGHLDACEAAARRTRSSSPKGGPPRPGAHCARFLLEVLSDLDRARVGVSAAGRGRRQLRADRIIRWIPSVRGLPVRLHRGMPPRSTATRSWPSLARHSGACPGASARSPLAAGGHDGEGEIQTQGTSKECERRGGPRPGRAAPADGEAAKWRPESPRAIATRRP